MSMTRVVWTNPPQLLLGLSSARANKETQILEDCLMPEQVQMLIGIRRK
jgi:hypothetical protein